MPSSDVQQFEGGSPRSDSDNGPVENAGPNYNQFDGPNEGAVSPGDIELEDSQKQKSTKAMAGGNAFVTGAPGANARNPTQILNIDPSIYRRNDDQLPEEESDLSEHEVKNELEEA